MATTTANMSLQKPDEGGDSGVWDTYLNASLDLLDTHNHSSGQGVRVPSAGLNINADLTFAGYGATNLKATQFTAQASYTTNRALFVLSSDNELYWRNNSGTNVKITSGTSLNLSLVGGITGDYAAAAASFYYDDTNKTYRALRTAPLPNFWASVSAGDVDLYEKASGITNRVRLSSPAALAASYALTFPAALPGSTVLVQCSSAGALTFSNTIANAVTFSGAVTLSSGVSGNMTATGEVTGTDLNHTGEQRLILPAAMWNTVGSAASFAATGVYIGLSTHTGGSTTPSAVCGIPLKHGDTITQIVVHLDKLSVSGTVTARFKSFNVSSGVTTDIASATAAVQSANISGLSTVVNDGTFYWVQIEGGGTTGDLVYGATVRFTRT